MVLLMVFSRKCARKLETLRLETLCGISVLVLVIGLPFSATAEELRLATTTSTANSGLLDHILPIFTELSGVEIKVSAVGTGQALRMGRNGRVDVVLVHAPHSEEEFVSSGYGVKRIPVMSNAFVLVGPVSDPADVGSSETVYQAMTRISENAAGFISRADDSGTHKKELSIWKAVDLEPFGSWYYEAGQGMKAVLSLASSRQSYALSDQGTWLSARSSRDLNVVYQSDEPLMQNPYSVIAVNPDKQPPGTIQKDKAEIFIAWLVSPETQTLIDAFRVDGFQLFAPAAPAQGGEQ